MTAIALPALFSDLSKDGAFLFDRPLLPAKILRRPNRFIVVVDIDGEEFEAHCPTTGSIGGWELSGLRCLISGPYATKRRTLYTLEAIEVPLANGATELVGINQSAANRYVEASLLTGQLEEAVGPVGELSREKKFGNARIDFNVDNEEFIEVKTPVKNIYLDTLVPRKESGYGSGGAATSVDRLLRHVRELTVALDEGQKAILLTCFIYDAPTFDPPKRKEYSELTEALQLARKSGLESWQVNYSIDRLGVSFRSLRRTDLGKS